MPSASNIDALIQVFRNLGALVAQIARKQSASHASMTKQELITIGILGDRGGCRLGEIAGSLGIGQSAVTPIADRLESTKLIKRTRSEHDRRVWTIELTKKGLKVFEQENAIYREMATSMLEPLNKSEQKTLVQLLSKMETSDLMG